MANDENGGVFAQVVGTKMCVSNKDWELCLAVIVNKYKGEIEDSVSGFKMLENMIGKPVYAMNFTDDWNVPKQVGICIESKLAWEKRGDDDKMTKNKTVSTVVVVVVYPHTTISNEVYPLEHDPRFRLEWRRKRLPKPYPATTAIILPGSSLTLLDLKWLQVSLSRNDDTRCRSFCTECSYISLWLTTIFSPVVTFCCNLNTRIISIPGFWVGRLDS